MEKGELKQILKYAGAFIAWVVGSGFATGQEILQFFGSYGYLSFAVVGLNLAGFLILGKVLMTTGYDLRTQAPIDQYRLFCGERVGKLYSVLVPVTLLLINAVLISASGATLEQYYGLNRYLGSALMAAAVLGAYLRGFEKMVKLISPIGPIIIVFCIFVGVFTVCRDFGNFSKIGDYADTLSQFHAAPHWSLSALLYLSLNFLCGSTYYAALGAEASSRRSAKWGAVLGAAALVATIAVMNLAIVLNAGEVKALSIPTLYLASEISGVFGTIFSLVLTLGIFVSCTTTVWSFCSGFFREDKKKNHLFSIGSVLVCLLLGFVPFGKLMSVAYPMIGYIGLYFIGCVVVYGLRKRTKTL